MSQALKLPVFKGIFSPSTQPDVLQTLTQLQFNSKASTSSFLTSLGWYYLFEWKQQLQTTRCHAQNTGPSTWTSITTQSVHLLLQIFNIDIVCFFIIFSLTASLKCYFYCVLFSVPFDTSQLKLNHSMAKEECTSAARMTELLRKC